MLYLVFLKKIFIVFFNVLVSFLYMNLDKLFWSKAKVDIFKYLLFRRQWISMRALESELDWTFPAIKKQIDSMKESNVILIDKTSNVGRSITLNPLFQPILKQLLYFWLKSELISFFSSYELMIPKYFFGRIFGVETDIDLIVIYNNLEKPQIDHIKTNIWEVFRKYMIENVSVVFMSEEERRKRYRLADRFVLNIMRAIPEAKDF